MEQHVEFPGEIMYGVGALILLGGIIWGVRDYKTRNRRNDRITEEAVRERYKHPETYEQKAEELRRKVEPS
jgi:hypothetical protein